MQPYLRNTILVLLALGHSFGYAHFLDDEKEANKHRVARLERLRVRNLLQPREECSTMNCMEEEDGWCATQGCLVCGASYYCVDQDEAAIPPLDQMVVMGHASDVPGKRAVLTNFLEKGQLEDHWLDPICQQITAVKSDQEVDAGSFFYSIQGSHKTGISLTHDGHYLDMMVTWEPANKRLLPLFDKVKIDLCKKAINDTTTSDTHSLHYGAFDKQSVESIKNRHQIQIQTPAVEQKRSLTGITRRGRTGYTIAVINIELGDHNKNVSLFNGNGLPKMNKD